MNGEKKSMSRSNTKAWVCGCIKVITHSPKKPLQDKIRQDETRRDKTRYDESVEKEIGRAKEREGEEEEHEQESLCKSPLVLSRGGAVSNT